MAQQRPAARGPRRARRLHGRTQRRRGAKKGVCNSYTLARDISHPLSLAFALCFTAIVHELRREAHATYERAEATIALCAEQGFAFWLAIGTIVRGGALAAQGQGEEGVAQIRHGLDAHRATEAELLRPYFLALLAEAYRKARQPEDGLTAVAEALALVEKNDERYYAAEIHRLKGELLLQQHPDNEPQAETCFQLAHDIARRQHAKSWELRAAMSLSRLWQQQGRREAARALLVPIYHWFTEGFDTADLQEARTLLGELA